MGGGDLDLKVEAIRGGVRNLKIDDAAAMRGGLKMEASAMWGGDRDLKMKEAAAMEGGDLNLKYAGRYEGSDTLKRKPWEVEGAILKLKKDFLTAMDVWIHKARLARNSSALKKDQPGAQEKALGARKKKMKVVKTKLSKQYIEAAAAYPIIVCSDLSEEERAQLVPAMREVYDAVKIYEAKRREYWDTLYTQQKEMGYAEEEIEVTDDEEEAVVKN